MTPAWVIAARKLKTSVEARKVPLVALGAAFSFVLMMFNFPVPGGSSGHAVGGAILAILLGPWVAVSVLSVVVAIQAFLFHDGGLTTFGANAFNMAFILPMSSYFVYRLLANAASSLFRKAWAGAVAGYAGLTLSAFTTAVMLGIQPHGVSGYAPYPLRITIPAMVGSHLLVFSWVEGIATAFVLVWVHQNFPMSYPAIEAPSTGCAPGQSLKRAWTVLFVLIVLSPLGLLAQGTAFGEWSEGELARLFGFAPAGFRNLSKIWKAPFPGYRITGHSFLYGYLFSAAFGAVAAALFAYVLARFLSNKSRPVHLQTDSVKADLSPCGDAVPDLPGGSLPRWMLKKEALKLEPERRVRDHGEKALAAVRHFFSHTLHAEEYQKVPGFLQKRDPRVKVVILSLFILAAAWIKSAPLLCLLLGVAGIFTLSSRIPFFWFARYVLLTMAAFSLLIALPALFSWVTPGKPWIIISSPYFIITREGVLSAGFFILRATTAIAFGALLSLTTSWTKLLRALHVLRVPRMFLVMAEMAYRYIFLFVRLLEQINYSRNARTITPFSTLGEQRWTAGRMAFLLNRSLDLSENVHLAMLARGYEGPLKSIDSFKLDSWDKIFGLGSVLFFSWMICSGLPGRFW